ncbi:hypothetical protein AB0758_00030 [Tolypothrix bouteillei VB521301_2]|uniref:hypothetical protein n=1 Tax=Tolypothrix bouteillei TaxID=1246981 RepID=UPI0038B56439
MTASGEKRRRQCHQCPEVSSSVCSSIIARFPAYAAPQPDSTRFPSHRPKHITKQLTR